MELPGNPECCWVARAGETDYPQPDRSVRTTVAIVGAGIVGLSVACLLAQAGVPATVVEARRIGRAVTGRSTAKITTQHGLIYADLISRLGMASASLYAQANSAAVRQILDWIGQYRIDCDLERRDAYAYTSRAERRAAIEAEVRAARSLGLPADAVSTAPLPFVTAGAVRFADQAQFNPASYLVGLAAAVNDRGGRIFENTRVSDVKRGRRWKLTIGRYRLEAEHVVLATNLPIGGPIPFDRMTRPRCHIAMAYRASAAGMLDGMFIGVDRPTHSLRMGRDDQGPLLVTLGPPSPWPMTCRR